MGLPSHVTLGAVTSLQALPGSDSAEMVPGDCEAGLPQHSEAQAWPALEPRGFLWARR